MPGIDWKTDADAAGLSVDEVRYLLQRYGVQSSASFVFQEGAKYFGNPRDGLICYVRQKSIFGETNIVFNNPVAPSTKLPGLLEGFLNSQKNPTLFVGVDKSVAGHLADFGYRANQIGVESSIALDPFTLHGKSKKQLRHASNFASRQPCRVSELSWKNVDAQQVLSISDKWRAQKKQSRNELKLLSRPPVFGDEWKVRKFYCLDGDKVLGYVFFEPYFSCGEIRGYCANIIRSLPDAASSGVADFIILEAIKQFRKEGVKQLSLGISPLYNIQSEANEWPLLRHVLNAIYRHGNALYACKGLAYHKTRYRPDQEPWYLCSKNMHMARLLWTLIAGIGVL